MLLPCEPSAKAIVPSLHCKISEATPTQSHMPFFPPSPLPIASGFPLLNGMWPRRLGLYSAATARAGLDWKG